jgi:hypothetical protein
MNAEFHAELFGMRTDGAQELAEMGAQAVAAYLAITGNGVANIVEAVDFRRAGQSGEHGAREALALAFVIC